MSEITNQIQITNRWTRGRIAALYSLRDIPDSALRKKREELGYIPPFIDSGPGSATELDTRQKELDEKEEFLAERERELDSRQKELDEREEFVEGARA